MKANLKPGTLCAISPIRRCGNLRLSLISATASAARSVLLLALLACLATISWAAATGSMSGTIKDPSGSVIPGASLVLANLDLTTQYKASTDEQGLYSFPSLPVGRYELTIEAAGFKTVRKTGLVIDTDAALKVDATLEIGQQSETVTVAATAATTEAQVDTVATHLGELVTGSQMTSLPLNGRSYTDLLSIQPGVIPVTTLQPNSVIMAGVTGAISPSGDLNPGNQSIDGQRESANGFMVNGVDVQEHMNGGTSIIPNLDSIDEFRVLTNNFDPEYGNYNGGMVTVVTKSGSDTFHGNAFEFLRNTALDARGYFDPTRPTFRQNQFGGTVGGPVKRQKIYFFSDYQGTRTNQGIPTGNITVPSLQDRTGNLSDLGAAAFSTTTFQNGQNVTTPATVSDGGYLASLLSQKLGYAVSPGEKLLHRGLHHFFPVRFPQRDHSPARLVGSGCEFAALYSQTQRERQPVFDVGLFADRARRQGFRPHRREHRPLGPDFLLLFF
jgi:hypothetical protein